MEKVQLVYAELTEGISISMFADPLVVIISDGALFLVTTKENSIKYQQEFTPVCAEAMEKYGIQYGEGRVTENQQ